MATYIPYVYKNITNRDVLDTIEEAAQKTNNTWFICGGTFVTKNTKGYYHVYVPENSRLYGKILADYRLGLDGKLHDTGKFYRVPTKESMIEWCKERGIEL